MQFWSAGHDPEHPLHGSTPERYGLLRFETGCYIAIAPSDQGLMDVEWQEHAHGFPTHEAALRAVAELRRLAQGSIDVIKVGGSLLPFRSG
jgi:hypothetical protein